jgi:hypothetical protein
MLLPGIGTKTNTQGAVQRQRGKIPFLSLFVGGHWGKCRVRSRSSREWQCCFRPWVQPLRPKFMSGDTGLHRHELILVAVCWCRPGILNEHTQWEKGKHETGENFQRCTLFGLMRYVSVVVVKMHLLRCCTTLIRQMWLITTTDCVSLRNHTYVCAHPLQVTTVIIRRHLREAAWPRR